METTGRSLVLFEAGAAAAGREAVQVAGGRYFEALGVAVLDGPPEQIARAGVTAAAAGVASVEPERVVRALGPAPEVDETGATWGLQATKASSRPRRPAAASASPCSTRAST